MTLHPSRTDPMPADANTLDATPSLIQWCQGHQRHVKTAMWLSSVRDGDEAKRGNPVVTGELESGTVARIYESLAWQRSGEPT